MDVSWRGCRIHLADARPPAGSSMWIELASGHRVAGEVIWSRGAEVGVRFHRPLPASAAIAFGLQTAEAKVEEKAQVLTPSALGILSHWIRRINARLR